MHLSGCGASSGVASPRRPHPAVLRERSPGLLPLWPRPARDPWVSCHCECATVCARVCGWVCGAGPGPERPTAPPSLLEMPNPSSLGSEPSEWPLNSAHPLPTHLRIKLGPGGDTTALGGVQVRAGLILSLFSQAWMRAFFSPALFLRGLHGLHVSLVMVLGLCPSAVAV